MPAEPYVPDDSPEELHETTTEVTTEVEELSPEIKNWSAFETMDNVGQAASALQGSYWAMRSDPENSDKYYISDPDKGVVMEGLSYETASKVMDLMSSLPEAVKNFEQLADMWNVLTTDPPAGAEKYLDIIRDYQLKLAQLSANPTPIPNATTAGELNVLHVGHVLRMPASPNFEFPITAVEASGSLVQVTLDQNVVMFLSPETPVEISPIGPLGIQPPEAEAPEPQTQEVAPVSDLPTTVYP